MWVSLRRILHCLKAGPPFPFHVPGLRLNNLRLPPSDGWGHPSKSGQSTVTVSSSSPVHALQIQSSSSGKSARDSAGQPGIREDSQGFESTATTAFTVRPTATPTSRVTSRVTSRDSYASRRWTVTLSHCSLE